MRSSELFSAATSQLLLVDLQEKLVPAMSRGPAVVDNAQRLAQGAELFGVPVFASEQYPAGLGPTVAPLRELIGHSFEKQRFSATDAAKLPPAGDVEVERHQIVVAGVEAHVCVLQTVLDVLALGYHVAVVVDAIDSRKDMDRQVALRRMESSGVVLTTVESVLFEWAEQAGTDAFRQLQKLIVPFDSNPFSA